MKFFILLLAIGCASASIYDALDQASDVLVQDFILGMEKSPSLKEVIGVTYSEEAQQLEEDIKTEVGKTLKERFDSLIQKIKDSVDHGKQVGSAILEKAKEIAGRLKELGEHAGENSKELLERLKNKAKDWINATLEKLGLSKRSLVNNAFEVIVAEFDIHNIIEHLKAKLSEKLNIQAIKDYVKKLFGELSATGEAILKTLHTQGVKAVQDLLHTILPHRETETKEIGVRVIEKRAFGIRKAACLLVEYVGLGWGVTKLQAWIDSNIESKWHGIISTALKYGKPTLRFVLGTFCVVYSPTLPQTYSTYSSVGVVVLWQKIKEYFKDIGIEFQTRFFKFAVWLKDVVKGGVENIKDQLEKVKEIAKQVVENGKTLTKEAAEEALEFFRPYKDDLGIVWEQLTEAVKNAIGH